MALTPLIILLGHFSFQSSSSLVGENRNWLPPSTTQRPPRPEDVDSDWPSVAPVRGSQEKGFLFQIQCLHFPLLAILVVPEWLSLPSWSTSREACPFLLL